MKSWLVVAVCAVSLVATKSASAQPTSGPQPGPDDVYIRVVDVGAGLCTITKAPGNHYMIYDTGYWSGSRCFDAAREIVEGDTVDLLVLSHSDSDHLGNADDVLAGFVVSHIVDTGFPRTTNTWKRTNSAIRNEVNGGATRLNLQVTELVPGTQLPLGDATVVLIAGWGQWEGEDGLNAAEERNAISIVVRLYYAGRSVLYTGDTTGRRIEDPNSVCGFAEALMVANADSVPLKSDVIIAPHHGGNNGSSRCFIEAVDPAFVIFAAGHRHRHPRAHAAQRYLDHGISADSIFRTDRGDDEGAEEWNVGRVNGCKDGSGDDSIEIVLTANGSVEVAYRVSGSAC